MNNQFNIQWYPGHMKKTRENLIKSINQVDATVEILDARIPISSKNPDIDKIISKKKRIVLLNKSDYSDSLQNKKWIEFFKEKDILAVETNCKNGRGLSKFTDIVLRYLKDLNKKWEVKGLSGRKTKLLVVGIPNVGKSSFINKIAKDTKAKAENRPGVTKQNQWYTVGNKLELLDTPGVLWPKFEDEKVAKHLAFTGCIKDEIMDVCELAANLLDELKVNYSENISKAYSINLEDINSLSSYEILEYICKKRGMIISKGEADLYRASSTVLREFRAGKLGRITLETTEKV